MSHQKKYVPELDISFGTPFLKPYSDDETVIKVDLDNQASVWEALRRSEVKDSTRKASPWKLSEEGGWSRVGTGEDLNGIPVAWVIPLNPVLDMLFKQVFGHKDNRRGKWRWTVAWRERHPYGDTAAPDAETGKFKADALLRKAGWELEMEPKPTSWKDHPGNFVKNGKLYLVRCPSCGLENYAPAVASGTCAFCGWGDPDFSKQGESNGKND
ncbi:MAG: hypothetical protein WC824_15710 [Bacteroidota bacterium]